MSRQQTTAKILDFQAFRERRTQTETPAESMPSGHVPAFFAWYPVWVLVPQFPYS